ncbi:MAG: DUF2065 domain-containing protein [Gammaproteobacteria bacterium]|nr:DUF2065 domain-containing protein [Gammaproteobacteria bacterium]MBU2477600.1 DUF2065 domain-containing protein [Gammaproteobacteria bacterium]
MFNDLLTALALLLVIEGIFPFLNPQALRRTMQTLGQMDDRSLRVIGLVSMLAGLLLLYLVR